MSEMDIVALAKEAVETVNHPVSKSLLLKLDGKWGKSNHRHLAGPVSPLGEIVRADEDGIIVSFEAVDVLAWCIANSDGTIKMSTAKPEEYHG